MSTRNDFEEIEVINDPDGVVGVITSRVKANGRKAYSYSLMKVYDKDGSTHRTCWLGPQHFDAVRRLVDKLERQIELLEDRDRAQARKTEEW